jgi:hypothetical protein
MQLNYFLGQERYKIEYVYSQLFLSYFQLSLFKIIVANLDSVMCVYIHRYIKFTLLFVKTEASL